MNNRLLPDPLLLHVLNFLRPKSHIEAMREDRISVEIKVDEENDGKEEKYPISVDRKSHAQRDFAYAKRVNQKFYLLANYPKSIEQLITLKGLEFKRITATKTAAEQEYDRAIPWGYLKGFTIAACILGLIGAINLECVLHLYKMYESAADIMKHQIRMDDYCFNNYVREEGPHLCDDLEKWGSICSKACHQLLTGEKHRGATATLIVDTVLFLGAIAYVIFEIYLRRKTRSQLDRESIDFYPLPIQDEIIGLSHQGLIPISPGPTVRDFRNQINEALRENIASQRRYLPNSPIHGLFQRRQKTPHIPYLTSEVKTGESTHRGAPILPRGDDQSRRSFCVML